MNPCHAAAHVIWLCCDTWRQLKPGVIRFGAAVVNVNQSYGLLCKCNIINGKAQFQPSDFSLIMKPWNEYAGWVVTSVIQQSAVVSTDVWKCNLDGEQFLVNMYESSIKCGHCLIRGEVTLSRNNKSKPKTFVYCRNPVKSAFSSGFHSALQKYSYILNMFTLHDFINKLGCILLRFDVQKSSKNAELWSGKKGYVVFWFSKGQFSLLLLRHLTKWS